MDKLTIISHELDGFFVGQRVSDGYVNATALATAYRKTTGRRRDPAQWRNLKRTKELFISLSVKTGIPVLDLVQVIWGGSGSQFVLGTWVHPELAVPFATWACPEFELFVSCVVQNWIMSGHQPATDVYSQPVNSAVVSVSDSDDPIEATALMIIQVRRQQREQERRLAQIAEQQAFQAALVEKLARQQKEERDRLIMNPKLEKPRRWLARFKNQVDKPRSIHRKHFLPSTKGIAINDTLLMFCQIRQSIRDILNPQSPTHISSNPLRFLKRAHKPYGITLKLNAHHSIRVQGALLAFRSCYTPRQKKGDSHTTAPTGTLGARSLAFQTSPSEALARASPS